MGDRFIQIQRGATHRRPERFAFEFFVALLLEEGFEHGEFIGCGRAGGAAAEDVGEALVIGWGFGDDLFGHGLGCFHEHLIIEQREGLQGAVGNIASREAGFTGRRIKRGGHGEGGGALGEGVEAAAEVVFAFADLPLDFAIGSFRRHAGWLRWIDAGATHFERQDTCGF